MRLGLNQLSGKRRKRNNDTLPRVYSVYLNGFVKWVEIFEKITFRAPPCTQKHDKMAVPHPRSNTTISQKVHFMTAISVQKKNQKWKFNKKKERSKLLSLK